MNRADRRMPAASLSVSWSSSSAWATGLLAAVTVFSGACGRHGELLGTLGDAVDGGVDGGNGGMRFSVPTLVASLSDPDYDGDPTFTGDLLELFFTSGRSGNLEIWTARRASASDPWGAPSVVPELNSTSADYGAAISFDGLRIWLTTERDRSPGRIWQSSRANRGAPWAAPQLVTELQTAPVVKDFAPAVDATETLMMFGSNRLGGMGFDIYQTTRPSVFSPWGVPRRVPGVNSAFDDWDPFVAQGGLIIFFTLFRDGDANIFWSARQSITGTFTTPLPLADVNSPAFDSDPSLSLDLSYLMFDSMRSGNFEIYEAHALR